MSGSRWDQPGVPHKGWHCLDVVDLRADGGPADETNYATCQMCGNEKIRYVHIMEHPDLDQSFEVGCVCAEKMSDDYEGPKRREAKLRNRAARRTRWPRDGSPPGRSTLSTSAPSAPSISPATCTA